MGQHTDGFVVGKNQRLDLAVESSVLINAPQYDRQRFVKPFGTYS